MGMGWECIWVVGVIAHSLKESEELVMEMGMGMEVVGMVVGMEVELLNGMEGIGLIGVGQEGWEGCKCLG